MGRGISNEQIVILWRASRPPTPGTPSAIDLLTRDAIEAVYPSLRYWRDREGDPPKIYADTWADQSSELKAAKAAISRSFRRLEERGLVERYHGQYGRWSGIKLTDEGRKVVGSLEFEARLNDKVLGRGRYAPQTD